MHTGEDNRRNVIMLSRTVAFVLPVCIDCIRLERRDKIKHYVPDGIVTKQYSSFTSVCLLYTGALIKVLISKPTHVFDF